MNLPWPIQKDAKLARCGHFVEDEIFGPPPGTETRFVDRPAGGTLAIPTEISWLALLMYLFLNIHCG